MTLDKQSAHETALLAYHAERLAELRGIKAELLRVMRRQEEIAGRAIVSGEMLGKMIDAEELD